MKKRKLYSFINVFGLALGVSVCLVILRYVDFELSYDRHHANGPNIYRTVLTRYLDGQFRDMIPFTGYGAGPALKADISQIKQVARTHEMFGGVVLSSTGEMDRVQFHEGRVILADPEFLEVFSFRVLAGKLGTALDGPNSLVITRTIAEKYFGRTDVLGKVLKVSGGWIDREFEITAVIDDQPENSSLSFDILLPLNDILQQRQYVEDNGWGWKNFSTYIQVYPDTDIKALHEEMPQFLSKYVDDKQEINFQPLFDIHTREGLTFDSTDRISLNKIYFFILIAVFILAIAWINYINLSTARAMERAREVGIKKVIGAQKHQLIFQFLLESGIINFFAVGVALLLAIWLLPFFAGIVGKNLTFDLYEPRLWYFLVGLVVGGTVLSGVYPAFILSSISINNGLKGGADKIGNFSMRRILVVFQFACSLILICLTFVVLRQIAFMEKQVSGLNMEEMLIVKAPYTISREGAENRLLTFKDQLRNLATVKSVCTSASVPGAGYSFTTVMRKQGEPEENYKSGNVVLVDPDFIETYNIKLIAGKVWENKTISQKRSLMINETALSTFEIENPEDALGHHLIFEGDTFAIAGVMSDYHWNSLKTGNVPLIFSPAPIIRHTFSIRLKPGNYESSISQIETLFKKAFPESPIEYYFLDDFFNQQYKDDQSFGKIFTAFALFAIVISCLGMLGLTAFTTEKKKKEIGIRKVLGATTADIISMLSRDLLFLLFLATLVSMPIMWYASNEWLDSFAFRMNLTPEIFIVPVFILTFIGLITVSANIVRGANANPARVLKLD